MSDGGAAASPAATAVLCAGGPLATHSGHPAIAREYRRICEALARCAAGTPVFDVAAYDAAAVARAREMWHRRILSEYESAAVFTQISLQTMEANAPIDATATVLRMAQDELRHAHLCIEIEAALGGRGSAATGAPALAPVRAPTAFTPLARHGACGAEERALRNIIYGCCLSETVNAARFVDALDAITDPYLRDVTRRLLADEALHAQFGFVYLELWRGWLDAEPGARDRLGQFLRRAFAIIERELSGVGARYPAPSPEEIALGVPPAERFPETFYRTMEQAIVPALAGFGLAAEEAWRRRVPS